MSLALGAKLGPYEVLGPLGAGGMGEVYRASDTKLKREVALKVLPELFAGDAQRMARFEREAQVLASLNHSNIAHIHGLEESNGIRALVMELVEGQTLAERIGRAPAARPMPAEEAAPLAKQIAEALEYAHDKGIVHRDLKPANIKLTPEGQVKVLDFGLAKALEGETGEVNISTSPTISVAATRAGVLLGTAAYMSPEQAKGKAVDRRADIWAFGCVLFEMLAGKAAFDGETITDTLAAVVRAEPEWSQLPEKTPDAVRELLQRCLVKDPKQRLQAIGEARIALEKYLANPRGEPEAVLESARSKERVLAGVAAVCAAAAILFGILYWDRAPERVHVVRSYIRAMPNSSFLFTGPPSGFALSPDGLRVAYVAQNAEGKAMLWVRALDSLQAHALEGTQEATFPFWSPDSRYIGFFADGKLKKIEASGGPPLPLCDAVGARGGTWNQEGVILFTPTTIGPIHRVSASGGTSTPVTTLDASKGESTHRWPYFLPDGRHFLYVAGSPFGIKESPINAIVVGALDSTESKVLMRTHSGAIYASGHIIFLRVNTLMAQPFDTKRLELTGDAFPVADPVQEVETILLGEFSASEDGMLAYLEGTRGAHRQVIWVDRNGKKVGEVPGEDAYFGPRISPDGKKLAFTLGSPGFDIWTYDIARGVKTRLTFGSASAQANLYEVWSRDGQRIAYSSVRGGKYGLYVKSADGSGGEEVLLEGSKQLKYVSDWSPDGKSLAYQEAGQGNMTIQILPLNGEQKPYTFLQSQFSEILPVFSPDGKWVAYCSNESGEMKVYVVPFPGPGGKWQVSPLGGYAPRWRRDGKEIFYISSDNKIMAAEVNGSASSFMVGNVKQLFDTRVVRVGVGPFDVTADGQRFIIAYEPGESTAAVTLVTNWNAELRKK
jgi:eukaryotic-like serine/threonine-protein kinase